MKTLRLAFLLLTFGLAIGAPRTAPAAVTVSFDFFSDALAPYGDWIEVGGYGPCWRPTVDADWAPYADGYWANTDAGWTWVSYEEFGGIVYHYGRWIRVEDEGWCWVPDTEWAPSWVSWRSNDDYVGWAPLPPEAHWRRETGISVWVDNVCDIGPGNYNFCHVHDFGVPVMRGVIINRTENVTIIRNTVNITNITYNTNYAGGPVIYAGGPNFAAISRRSSRPIPSLKLVQNANFDPKTWQNRHHPGSGGAFISRTVGNQLVVMAPPVAPPASPEAFHPKTKRVIAADKVTKGWGAVKDPEAQKDLRAEIKRQSHGLTPETAPARPVSTADLQEVPVKGDPKATPAVTVLDHKPEKPGKGAPPNGIATEPAATPATTPLPSTPTVAVKPHGTPIAKPIATPVAKSPTSLTDTPLISTPRPAATPDAVARERARMRNSPPGTPNFGGPAEKPYAPVATPERKSKVQFEPFTPTTPMPRRATPPSVQQRPVVTDPGRIRPEDAMAQRQAEIAAQRAAAARAEAAKMHQQAAHEKVQQMPPAHPPQPHTNTPGGSPTASPAHSSKSDKDKDKKKDSGN